MPDLCLCSGCRGHSWIFLTNAENCRQLTVCPGDGKSRTMLIILSESPLLGILFVCPSIRKL
jgi:hypothetical protein